MVPIIQAIVVLFVRAVMMNFADYVRYKIESGAYNGSDKTLKDALDDFFREFPEIMSQEIKGMVLQSISGYDGTVSARITAEDIKQYGPQCRSAVKEKMYKEASNGIILQDGVIITPDEKLKDVDLYNSFVVKGM